jgi:hypothetical protein
LEEKNLFHENPVEVRSFDGIEVNTWARQWDIYLQLG